MWTGAYAGLGFLFGHQLDRLEMNAQRMGSWLLMLFVAGVIA